MLWWKGWVVDLAGLMEFSRDSLRAHRDLRAVTLTIERCAEDAPDPIWREIAGIDFEGSFVATAAWFEHVLAIEPPSQDINALWFGVFNPEYEGEAVTSDFYVAGSRTYGTDGEWMCDLPWWPVERFAESVSRAAIYRLGATRSADVLHLADYIVTLTHAAATVSMLMSSPPIQALLSDRVLAVAVGYDSGDAVLLGMNSSSVFEVGDCPWV
jgi:hypothetical protein